MFAGIEAGSISPKPERVSSTDSHAVLVREIADLRQINAELVKALKEMTALTTEGEWGWDKPNDRPSPNPKMNAKRDRARAAALAAAAALVKAGAR